MGSGHEDLGVYRRLWGRRIAEEADEVRIRARQHHAEEKVHAYDDEYKDLKALQGTVGRLTSRQGKAGRAHGASLT